MDKGRSARVVRLASPRVTPWVAGILLAALLTVPGPVGGGERWGWLGVRIRDLTEREMEEITLKQGVREGYGVVIADVLKDAPAASSSLKTGDLVVAIGGRPVVETRELQRIVGATPAGQELSLVVLRDEGRREVRVRVGQMPPDVVAERVAAEFGFSIRDAAPDDTPVPAPKRAPIVGVVVEGSLAERGGLAVGDRILAVSGEDVVSLDDFRRRVQEHLLRDELRLSVERKGTSLRLVLPPAQTDGLPR